MMDVVKTIESLRTARRLFAGKVGVVLTMGALHAGHLALVEQARADNDVVLVTIFVNPTQFATNEDLSKYPRDLPRDLDLLRAADVNVVFTPTPDLMYPSGFQTWIEVIEVSQGLEGARRPGHFRGVATIVAKLFNLTQPDRAYFGQKDAQQVAVIKRMTYDLNFPLELVVYPTLRESDGLAMSSRNVYLTAEQRQAASTLYRALQAAADAYDRGDHHPDHLRQIMLDTLRAETLIEPDYVSAADAAYLRELEQSTEAPVLISLAARLGNTHLIDNLLLPAHLNNRADLSRVLGRAF
jgi:pantoate--beta-alanine ligase